MGNPDFDKSKSRILDSDFIGIGRDYALFFFDAFFFFAILLRDPKSLLTRWDEIIFKRACPEKNFFQKFLGTIDLELIIALKKFLVNDFLAKVGITQKILSPKKNIKNNFMSLVLQENYF